jgi:hypothetical protein
MQQSTAVHSSPQQSTHSSGPEQHSGLQSRTPRCQAACNALGERLRYIALAVRLESPFSASTLIAEATAWILPLGMAWGIALMVEGRERVTLLHWDGALAVLFAWAASRITR